MTVVFSAAWQSFRLGLPASSPIGRACVTMLRETLSSTSQSKQHCRSIHGYFKYSPISPPPKHHAMPKHALRGPFPQLSGQARYSSLWKNDVEGPQRPKAAQNEDLLSRAEIKAIFGLEVDRKDGNDLLKRLQEQRHQGTLDQKLPYPDSLIEKGLSYLRAKHHFDEDAAIIARIDIEADGEFRLPQTNIGESPQAVSQFDKLRQENRNKLEIEKAQQETEKQDGLTEELPKADRRVTVRDGTALVQLRPEPEWVQRYRDRAQMKELPEMSTWARLVPSGLLTVAVVILAVLFAQNYKQPSRKARIWPDLPPAAATVITLIGVNVAVFVLWRLPPLWNFLNRKFLVVPAYPHSISMLTACFSHQSFAHLLANMIPLWLIGTRRTSTLVNFPLMS